MQSIYYTFEVGVSALGYDHFAYVRQCSGDGDPEQRHIIHSQQFSDLDDAKEAAQLLGDAIRAAVRQREEADA